MSGPIAPNTLDPPSDPTTSLAARAPAPILIISCFRDWNAVLRTFNPPFRSPLRNAWAAWPAFAASKNARPAPVSIKLIENVFLRLDRRAFLRLATIGVTPESGAAIETPDCLFIRSYLNKVSGYTI